MGEEIACRAISLVRRDAHGAARSVLETLDATFLPGQIAVVSGPTGAGKSSLMHILAGLVRPTSGVVAVGLDPVSRWIAAHRDRWRRRVGIVFQHPRLLADLTVLENVMLPLIPRGMGMAELRQRGRDALARLGAGEMAGERVSTLSGGERQITAIARALVSSPSILLADEPTAHQDRNHLRKILSEFRMARERNAVVIVAAHDPRLIAEKFADRYYRLDGGRLKETG
jgi:ABC-type lipoprotein export system ATPase subunit